MSVLAACIHGCLVKIQTGTRTRRVASIGQPGGFNWEQRTMGPPGKGQRIHVRYGMPEDLEDIFGGGGAFSDFFASICGGMGGA